MQVIEQYHTILTPIDSVRIYTSIERAGRTAYKSEDHITSGSAERFIASILKRGHESVLEHENLQVKFVTDRGVTHELVRHRLCAYTQESTRYCNYSKKGVVFIRPVFWAKDTPEYLVWLGAMEKAEFYYNMFLNNSYNRTPQEARSVLPNSLKTEIVTTANIREWRHILHLRTGKDAHPQMRALMLPLLSELQQQLSVLFSDIQAVS